MSPTKTAIYSLQQRYGIRKTAWILEFLAKWAIAVRTNGWEPISPEQYAEYWRISRAKGYRDRQRWADMFPNEPDPTPRILAGRAEYERLAAEIDSEPTMGDVAALFATMPAV